MLSFRIRSKQIMDSSFFEDVSRELRSEDDDEEDTGEQRHFVLLRLPRSLQTEERVHVWVQQLEGRSTQGEDLSYALPQEYRTFQLQ